MCWVSTFSVRRCSYHPDFKGSGKDRVLLHYFKVRAPKPMLAKSLISAIDLEWLNFPRKVKFNRRERSCLFLFAPQHLAGVQFSRSVVSDYLWPHGLQHARPPFSSPTPRVLLKLMSIDSVMPSNHLILCHPLLLPPSIFPSIKVFTNESVPHIR